MRVLSHQAGQTLPSDNHHAQRLIHKLQSRQLNIATAIQTNHENYPCSWPTGCASQVSRHRNRNYERHHQHLVFRQQSRQPNDAQE